jgi:hypothetical protein
MPTSYVDTSGTNVSRSFNSDYLNSLDFGGSGNNYNAPFIVPATTAFAGMGDWGGGGIKFGNTTMPGIGSGGDGANDNFLQRIGFLGNKEGAGWGGLALGGIQGAANLFMGMKQYGMAKDALNQAKEQYNKNYAAQKTTTNASLEDRQRARVASSPNAYISVDEYMAQNGIK